MRRLARFVGVTMIGVAILVPAAVFARESIPYREVQNPAPVVTLPPSLVALAAEMPSGKASIPVINYHDISDRHGLYSVSPRVFAEQLDALRTAGFRTVSLQQLQDLVAGRSVHLPERPLMITFDDGVATAFTNADPILAANGFTAINFLITHSVPAKGPSYYLTVPQIRMMAKSGRWAFGSHTDRGHSEIATGPSAAGPWLTNLEEQPGKPKESLSQWEQRVSADLDRSQHLVAKWSGQDVRALAFPFSSHDYPTNDSRIPGRLRDLVRASYSVAFTADLNPTVAVTRFSVPEVLPRFEVTSLVSAADLLKDVAEMIPRSPIADPGEWDLTGVSGTCDVHGTEIRLSGYGYMRCLPRINGEYWTNYSARFLVERAGPESTILLTMRESEASRVEVGVSNRKVVLRELVVGSGWHHLGAKTLPEGDVGDHHVVDLSVVRDQVKVTVDSRTVLTGTLSSSGRGPIGFGMASRGQQHVVVSVQSVLDLVPAGAA